MTITVKTIVSSISQGIRLDAFECEFPRIILAELNKHRALSNSVESIKLYENRNVYNSKYLKGVSNA